MYTCPVCYYTGMQDPPMDYNICECCGTEFGNDDAEHSHEELRSRWIDAGAKWYFRQPPVGWNPWTQLFMANVDPPSCDVIPVMLGSAMAETATMIYAPNLKAPTYYGGVTIYGAGLDEDLAIHSDSGGVLRYYGASASYGVSVLDTATMIYAGQDVLACAA